MKKFIAAIALAVLTCTSVYAMDSDYHDAPAPNVQPVDGDFPILFEISLDMSIQCVGVGFDGDLLWVSSGDYLGACMFYIFDEYGNLIDEVEQGGGATGWGHRDLAFDGTYMVGSYNLNIDCFSTWTFFDGYYVGPLDPNRALAYDGTYYYTCGYGELLYKIEWDGNFGSTGAATPLGGPWEGAYGLAYDCFNDCLWMTISLVDEPGYLHQLDRTGFHLTTYSLLPEYGRQGGCTMADTRFGRILVVLQQADVDMLTFYDVGSGPSPVPGTSWGAMKAMFR